MIAAPLPDDECDRLAALYRYDILDTPPEEKFERFPALVTRLLDVPSAVISFVDANRQWFKARINVSDQETSRDIAFCAHAILGDDVMVVEDASQDPRFHDNPLVTRDGGTRFYAGAPICTPDNFPIGVLCAIDNSSRRLTPAQKATLRDLAALVADQLELRLVNQRLVQQLAEYEGAEARLREKKRKLELSNLRFDAALNNISQGLCLFDADHKVAVANIRFSEIYSLSFDDVKSGRPLREIEAACKDRGTFVSTWSQDRLCSSSETVAEIQHLSDGRVISVQLQHLADGGWMTAHEDITERYRNEQQVAYMARHDLLTGLFNRAAFSEKIDDAGARLRRWGAVFAVVLLDLDRFKQVNDTLGHPAGDALLRETAHRLKGCLREADVLARLGGDEFAVLLTGAPNQRSAVIAFVQRIIDSLAPPCEVEGQTLAISTSIGIALAPEHGVSPDELIKNADLALYRAKGDGRNGYAIYDPTMTVHATARQELERDLRRAIANDEMELHYQPQIEAKTGRVSGAEALLRWRHPTRGFIPPSEFIPIAEETGLIECIGEWVLHAACTEAAGWPADTKLAVNLSPVQFRKGNIFNTILCALVESGLPAERLEVEVTESLLLESDITNLDIIRNLQNIGVSVALDDFGTGYASLSYLTRFPFDTIKIEKFFTMHLMDRSDCAPIVSSVITLARGLDMTTVAEGVETMQHFEFLRSAGIDFCQGYLFGRPVPASELDFSPVETTDSDARAA
ncbi:MAG: EAL domain-containing protein [Methylacidiphilales bacterium]|nr:EAL domain-containing protein [Candidatus Methylacidiphilales bacterium]